MKTEAHFVLPAQKRWYINFCSGKGTPESSNACDAEVVSVIQAQGLTVDTPLDPPLDATYDALDVNQP